jgi:hypothetical protein
VSFQAVLDNRTPFGASKFVLPDPEGQETVLIVVVATFEAATSDSLKLADEQRSVHDADEHYGEPPSSSVRYEADLALQKPAVDVLVNGHAYAPHGQATAVVPMHISIADIKKDLVVSGDRFWRRGPLGFAPSSPEPFVRLPIVYERAFGGMTDQAAEPRNLVGVGFRSALSRDPAVRTEVPNIEYPGSRMRSKSDRPEPGGFGVVSRGWLPRLRYAGTFDQQWLDQRWPLLPRDFDSRHNQCAPADQQSQRLEGGEFVRLVNLTPNGEWRFRLPTVAVPMALFYEDRFSETRLRLDTVMIEPDTLRLTLTSRATIKAVRNRGLLRQITLGHMSRGWLRGRASRKSYIDHRGLGGVLRDAPDFVL